MEQKFKAYLIKHRFIVDVESIDFKNNIIYHENIQEDSIVDTEPQSVTNPICHSSYGDVVLLEYTRYNDINGKQAYYKDICLYKDQSGTQQRGVIEWYNGWYFKAIDGDDEGNQDNRLDECDFEILGNEYEGEIDKAITSRDWLLMPEFSNIEILDHDGWDRKNFTYSFHEELITKKEFQRRLSISTVGHKKSVSDIVENRLPSEIIKEGYKESEIKSKRYGKIKATKEIYETFWKTIKGVIPYKVEFHYIDKCFHIECECDLFDLVKENEFIPEYCFILETKPCDPLTNDGKTVKQYIQKAERLKE